MIETLTSPKNPKILCWKSLKDPKGRKAHQAFLVEGSRLVSEALASSFRVEALLLRTDHPLPEGLPDSLPVYLLPEQLLAAVCDTKTPQGIAAIVRIPEGSGSLSLPENGAPLKLLALDDLQDPGNVGTILRTADAAGFDGAILSPGCADVFSPKVLRATMGSIFRVPLFFPESLAEALEYLRGKGFSILSSQLDGSSFYDRQNVSPSLVLIIGNEGNGISPRVRETATHRLALPMRGGAESLNAAVAAGIMMYELTR